MEILHQWLKKTQKKSKEVLKDWLKKEKEKFQKLG